MTECIRFQGKMIFKLRDTLDYTLDYTLDTAIEGYYTGLLDYGYIRILNPIYGGYNPLGRVQSFREGIVL